MKSIQDEIAELRKAKVPELIERYTELFGKPPRTRNRRHLWKRCASKVQEARFGGLSKTARRRLDELIAELDLPFGKEKRSVTGQLRRSRPGDPVVGTTLTRKWKDVEIRVHVRDDGYEWDGTVYRSLSAAAKAITGSHWSGMLFFGLRKRSSKK